MRTQTKFGEINPVGPLLLRRYLNFGQRSCERVYQVFHLKEPEPRRFIKAAGDNPAVFRADRHRVDRAIVAAQNHEVGSRIFCAQIPEPRRFVPADGYQPVVIRADIHHYRRGGYGDARGRAAGYLYKIGSNYAPDPT